VSLKTIDPPESNRPIHPTAAKHYNLNKGRRNSLAADLRRSSRYTISKRVQPRDEISSPPSAPPFALIIIVIGLSIINLSESKSVFLGAVRSYVLWGGLFVYYTLIVVVRVLDGQVVFLHVLNLAHLL
jgi:hypothetical protein